MENRHSFQTRAANDGFNQEQAAGALPVQHRMAIDDACLSQADEGAIDDHRLPRGVPQ
jgi:hypothetical protein